MFFRAIIFSLLLLAGTGAVTSSIISAEQTSVLVVTYIYERVKIDGVWWIFVYNEDGTFVNCYPDE